MLCVRACFSQEPTAVRHRAIEQAGVPSESHRTDGAGHGLEDSGYAERSRPELSEDAWGRSNDFLDRNLKSRGQPPASTPVKRSIVD